jgi:hypothetical protein
LKLDRNADNSFNGINMADANREQIEQLVARPAESLVVEIKAWISPTEPSGKAKIIKAAIALRNRDGGFIIIGFNDKTLEPERQGMPDDVRMEFHVDVIQGIVTKHSSEAFEIAVEFVEKDGIVHPVIVVPAGVKTPVAARADLKDGNDFLIRADDVYVRTLSANNAVSSAKAKWKDWSNLIETCFNNREADIGRFLRRHLSGADPVGLREFAMGLAANGPVQESVRERLEKLIGHGLARFRNVVEERHVELPQHGSWEVALIIDGQFPLQAGMEEFANLLSASNPSYTGWPMWLNSRPFHEKLERPYVYEGAWEALIVSLVRSSFSHIDFMRKDPKGYFYSYRALEDDISSSDRAPAPLTCLDAILPIIRVAEAIAVGHAFATALHADENTKLEFVFRWSGLKGRELTSWVEPMRYVSHRTAQQDSVTSTITLPIDTVPSTLAEYVKTAIKPLYEIFEGFTMPGAVVEELTQKLLERRL